MKNATGGVCGFMARPTAKLAVCDRAYVEYPERTLALDRMFFELYAGAMDIIKNASETIWVRLF